MTTSGGPRWAKEIVYLTIWSAAAANVFLYTLKTTVKMYKKPPLSAWQGTTKQGASKSEPQPNTTKPGGESLPEEALGLGEEALKAIPNPLKLLGL